jgi:hypothetical protein
MGSEAQDRTQQRNTKAAKPFQGSNDTQLGATP